MFLGLSPNSSTVLAFSIPTALPCRKMRITDGIARLKRNCGKINITNNIRATSMTITVVSLILAPYFGLVLFYSSWLLPAASLLFFSNRNVSPLSIGKIYGHIVNRWVIGGLNIEVKDLPRQGRTMKHT